MFDVSWTDPASETVGQRKARKEKNAESNGLSRASSMKSSNSGGSDQAHSKPSLLGLLGNIRKDASSRAGAQSKLATKHPDDAKLIRRLSSISADSDSSIHDVTEMISTTVRSPRKFFEGSTDHSETELSTGSPSDASESIFSGWTGRSARTQSTWSSGVESTGSPRSIVQPLSPDSFVTQSTEITVSPRTSVSAAEQVATVVRISAASTVPTTIPELPMGTNRSPQLSAAFEFPIPNLPNLTHAVDLSRGPQKGEGLVHPPGVVPIIDIRGPNSDKWKPPGEWACPEDGLVTQEATITVSPTRPSAPPSRPPRKKGASGKRKKCSAELTHLRRSIRRMEAASPKIALERLKEEWVEVADASVYRELELEKQLWMLTALRKVQGKKLALDSSLDLEAPLTTRGTTKVLSLYENNASCSSLAALTTATQVHHLSTSPLSPKAYPNIYPLAVPGPSAQLSSYASNNFASIHAFTLPALLPASSIPMMLRECYRTLISAPISPQLASPQPSNSALGSAPVETPPSTSPARGGVLHLTLLDPTPQSSTLGPLLRTWLEKHLLVNLEKQFRCLNPSRLFPDWLLDAGLRAKGSTIIQVKFYASIPTQPSPSTPSSCASSTSEGSEGEGSTNSKGDPKELDAMGKADFLRQELKSQVGRMLWKEMWGGYVQGEAWWWEDEELIEECDRLGTVWEYSVIEAVKEG